jgi:Domain of unknown function (DUF4276)
MEGQTEEGFVNEVLRNHLVEQGYHSVEARIFGNARLRGGIPKWPSARTDIMNHLREDPDRIVTTMVDYYALPQKGPGGWPGRAEAARLRTTEQKGRCVQNALRADLIAEMGSRFDSKRFVPFVVMHEFEGLLFSDCAGFSRVIGGSGHEADFRKIREQFPTPEEINDSPATAPSKASRLSCQVTRSHFWECVPSWRLDSRAFVPSVHISMGG